MLDEEPVTTSLPACAPHDSEYAVVVVSLPLIAVGALMCVALVQGLRSDRADSDFGT
jgi:hypothetical protein